MKSLPTLMVAPNGARRKKQDHPGLPVTISELVTTVSECHRAGANGCHFHVRDDDQNHVLDVGLYREGLRELSLAVPDMVLQVTTEAVGKYTSEQQRQVVYDLKPDYVSVAFREMTADGDLTAARRFYCWCLDQGVAVQHILYSAEDRDAFSSFFKHDISQASFQLMFVLGSYAGHEPSRTSDLDAYLAWLSDAGIQADWATCAFGSTETECLTYAFERGGKVRVGFENSIWNADGSIAANNAERVAEIIKARSKAKTLAACEKERGAN